MQKSEPAARRPASAIGGGFKAIVAEIANEPDKKNRPFHKHFTETAKNSHQIKIKPLQASSRKEMLKVLPTISGRHTQPGDRDRIAQNSKTTFKLLKNNKAESLERGDC